MDGQLSVFDITPQRLRPCDYRFKRYIGQRVRVMFGTYLDRDVVEGVITEIMPYYTIVRVGRREHVCTPYNLSEV